MKYGLNRIVKSINHKENNFRCYSYAAGSSNLNVVRQNDHASW